MNALWQKMREVVIDTVPEIRKTPFRQEYAQAFERLKQYYSYHSLTIDEPAYVEDANPASRQPARFRLGAIPFGHVLRYFQVMHFLL